MGRHKAILLVITMLAAGISGAGQADAQTFHNYRCADGTQFIVAFYDATDACSSRSTASRRRLPSGWPFRGRAKQVQNQKGSKPRCFDPFSNFRRALESARRYQT
ncbi:hypothetical protein [Bradyrhizobium ganzhouense]|uniref:hypothetical protein n=1 Tax=Bradyrhizobium ganzhouense TaxID=1179767 RepID=UPI003CEE158C